MNYKIEDIKCGITNPGLACGPIPGIVVASIMYSDGDSFKWLNNVEVEGIPNIYLTDKDIFDDLLEENYDDEEFLYILKDSFVNNFGGVNLTSYEDMFTSLKNNDNNEAKLIKALFLITRCDIGHVEIIINKLTDKLVSESELLKLDMDDLFYH